MSLTFELDMDGLYLYQEEKGRLILPVNLLLWVLRLWYPRIARRLRR